MKSKEVHRSDMSRRIINAMTGEGRFVYMKDMGRFAVYKDGAYDLLETDEMERIIYRKTIDHDLSKDVTKATVRDIHEQMVMAAPIGTADVDHVALNDCLLNLTSFRTKKHDPDILTCFRFPYDSSALSAKTPAFDHFLETSLVEESDPKKHDPQLALLMQEMFGNIVINGMKAAAAFFLVGDGANGKSVTADLIRTLIGERYVTSMSLEMLTARPFAAANLVGVKVNVCNEEESKYLRSDRFKALVTGDPITVERKFERPFEFRSRAKFVFCSNRLPTFDNMNHGLRRRLRIIPFHRVFAQEEQILDLDKMLHRELPGIFGWAIEGAKRLIKNNYRFTRPDQSETAMKDLENESSSVVNYFRTHLEYSEDVKMTSEELYLEYQIWSAANGRKPLNSWNFLRELNGCDPRIKSAIKKVSGKVCRVYPLKKQYDPDTSSG